VVAESSMESRISALENNHRQLEVRLTELDKKVADNTEITNSIKDDTSQIVALFKASKLGATIIQWLATVGGGLIIAYAAYKGLTAR
jgi:hypothetical protein